MHSFVRNELGIPFHRGLIEHPSPYGEQEIDGRPKKTIGSWIGLIHDAVRDGRIYEHIMQCLEDV
jgi:phenylalanine ammonia-lyase